MAAPSIMDPINFGNPPGQGPLRVNGVNLPAAYVSTKGDLPSTRSASSQAQQPDVVMVRDLWMGNRAIHLKTTEYLPRSPGEDLRNYQMRLTRAVFVNVFRNTIEGLVGFMYRADPQLGEDVPSAIHELSENIDNAGTHLDVFLRDLTADAMTAGHAAIFVEFPKTGGAQSLGDERGTVRPYWLPIRKENIMSWRTLNEGGHLTLTQIVLRECTYVPDGAFGDKELTQYRVLYRENGTVGFRLLEVSQDQKTVLVRDEGTYPTLTEIPIAEIRTSGHIGLFESTPPFLDLGYLNLAHYRQWSDYDTGIYATNCPIWVETGIDVPIGPDGKPLEQQITLGPNSYRRFTNPQAKAGYSSHDGAALGATKQSLDDLKQDMAALGLAALQSQKRVAETAKAKELDKGTTDSALAVTARGVQDGVEKALDFTAQLMGLDEGGSIEINRDYGDMVMDAPTMLAYATLADTLSLPIRVVLEKLVEGHVLPDNTDIDALEEEILAEQAAKDAEAQRIAADQAKAVGTSPPSRPTLPPAPK